MRSSHLIWVLLRLNMANSQNFEQKKVPKQFELHSILPDSQNPGKISWLDQILAIKKFTFTTWATLSQNGANRVYFLLDGNASPALWVYLGYLSRTMTFAPEHAASQIELQVNQKNSVFDDRKMPKSEEVGLVLLVVSLGNAHQNTEYMQQVQELFPDEKIICSAHLCRIESIENQDIGEATRAAMRHEMRKSLDQLKQNCPNLRGFILSSDLPKYAAFCLGTTLNPHIDGQINLVQQIENRPEIVYRSDRVPPLES